MTATTVKESITWQKGAKKQKISNIIHLEKKKKDTDRKQYRNQPVLHSFISMCVQLFMCLPFHGFVILSCLGSRAFRRQLMCIFQ